MLPSEPPRGVVPWLLQGLPHFACCLCPAHSEAHPRRGAPSTQGSPNPALHSALWFPTDCVYSFCLCLFGATCCSLLTTAVTILLCKAFSILGSFILLPFVGAGAPPGMLREIQCSPESCWCTHQPSDSCKYSSPVLCTSLLQQLPRLQTSPENALEIALAFSVKQQ